MEQSAGKNFFVKYWNGEIPLWKSFWLIYIPIMCCCIYCCNYSVNDLYVNYNKVYVLPMIIFLHKRYGEYPLFLIFLQTFNTMGLWKSATNYNQNHQKIWGAIIHTLIVFYIIIFIKIIFDAHDYSIDYIQEKVISIDKSIDKLDISGKVRYELDDKFDPKYIPKYRPM